MFQVFKYFLTLIIHQWSQLLSAEINV